MTEATLKLVTTRQEMEKLDELLWQVLWQPLGLRRNIRRSFKLDGPSMELAAKIEDRMVGGLVAVWTGATEVELRHLAVRPGYQSQGIGRLLVAALIERVTLQGCQRIQTFARSPSTDFYRKLGFRAAPGNLPDHPDFKKQGITFVLMEKEVKPADSRGPK